MHIHRPYLRPLLISLLATGAALAVDIQPIQSADDITLAKLTPARIAAMNAKDVTPFYAARMSSPGPGNAWISVVDTDVLVRPEAADILSELLARPAHGGIRPNVWSWLAKHPSFSVRPSLFDQSMELYRHEGQTWRWRDRAGFADFISVFGTAREAPVIDELAKYGGPGVESAKERFDSRMNTSGSPNKSAATTGAQVKQPAPEASETKPVAGADGPAASSSWFGLRLLLVVTAAIGLLIAVFVKLRRG